MESEHFSRSVDRSLEDPSEAFVAATATIVFFLTNLKLNLSLQELQWTQNDEYIIRNLLQYVGLKAYTVAVFKDRVGAWK